ncbi:MAG: hypothetical protein ACK5NG_00075 [Chthoniobacterales bacterium]
MFTSSSGSAVFGFGWFLGDNGNSNNESFAVYNTSDELIGTLSEVPFSDLSVFIGFTSSEPVGRVVLAGLAWPTFVDNTKGTYTI